MFRQVFNPENLLWKIVASGVDFVGLSLFWVLLCLPLVTIAPATAALYYTTVRVFRQGADDGFTLMWREFRKNLRKGLGVSLICLPLIVLICYGYSVMFANSASNLGAVMFTAYYLALVIPVGMMIYLFAYMGRFDTDLGTLFKNSFILTLRHLPTTIILVLLVLELIFASIRVWAWLFVTPVGGALLISFFLEKIFLRYLSLEEKAAFLNKTEEQVRQAEEKEQETRRRFLPHKK